jgi:hypothetical protein
MIVIFIASEKSWMFLTIRNIQLFSDNLNITIIYTNRQEHPNLLRMDKLNNHIPKSLRTFNTSQKLSTELSYTQIWYEFMSVYVYEKILMILTICVCDSSIDNFREKLNLLDDLCIWYHIHKSSGTFNSSLII